MTDDGRRALRQFLPQRMTVRNSFSIVRAIVITALFSPDCQRPLMAIEFNCPYCTATIRVPDAYAGQQGRCPKCDTKLLVPTPPRPGSTTPVGSNDSATQLPGAASRPLPLSTSSEPEFPSAGFVVSESSTVRTGPGRTSVRRRRRDRLPARILMAGVPVVGFLILLAAIFWSLTDALDLSGELTARRLSGAALPAVTLPWNDVDLADADRQELKEFLMSNPEVLSSRLVTCRLVGTEEGIEVRLTSGREGHWVVVTTTGNGPLAQWRKKEQPRLNPWRVKSLRETLSSWAKDKLAQSRGEPIAIDAAAVRDKIGFIAGGGILSFVTGAVVGEQLIPAAAEDKDGNLVFSLPKDATAFRIIGRTFPDGTTQFAGDYSVSLSDDVIVVEEPSADDATDPDMENAPTPAESGSEPDMHDSDDDATEKDAAKRDSGEMSDNAKPGEAMMDKDQ